jgi:hypothetical protein
MDQITTLAGPVGSIQLGQNITVTTNGSQTTATAVQNTMGFRIANRPVSIKIAVNLTDGDMVTAAGIQRGEFEILALNNHTTQTIYSVPKSGGGCAAVFLFVLGIPMLAFFLLGVIPMIVGVLAWLHAQKEQKQLEEALARVKSAPAPVSR